MINTSSRRYGTLDTNSIKSRDSVAGLSYLSERKEKDVEQKNQENDSLFYKGMDQIEEQSVNLANESSQKPTQSVSQNVDSGTSKE